MSGQITINATILQSLAAHLSRPVSEADQARAATHVLDWLGCAMLGCTQSAAAGFARMAEEGASVGINADGVSTLHGLRRDWHSALALNAAVGNLLEMDDLHRTSILHPGPVIVPAALAVAEHIGASGAELLAAVVRGYEATIRIGAALGTSHYYFFHNTSTCGAFRIAFEVES
jgi:2-methylcitrate dehydratase PrpD